MNFLRLLAKSSRTPDNPLRPETLKGHLVDVGGVALALAGERANGVLVSLGLETGTWQAPLAAAAVRGALLHDLGKANDHFQQMVRGQGRRPQALRHELISLWLLASCRELDGWLFRDVEPLVRFAALRAIAGHHLQFNPSSSLEPRPSGTAEMQILVDHPDFHDTLEGIADLLGLRSPPPSLATRSLHLIRDTLEQVRDLLWESATWWAQSSPEDRRFAAAVMALVIGADVCGSIIVREGQEPAQWAAEVLGHTCQGTDLAQAAHRRLVGAAPRPFQEDVAASPTRLTLVSAGCGTGKTVAAYLWAARRLEKRKLFFCYPTTGTTTEGFLDYAFPEFEGEAALVHSRSILDIQCILDNGGDEVSAVGSSHFSRYQGLHPWGAMVTVCTADAVLGLVQNNRVGLIGFPALAGAGFVFDEIHLYDNRMFGALLVFLETIRGTPVLLMTATLPPARRAALLALAQRLSEEVSEVPGPPELEELPRYTLSPATWEEALGRAVREVSAGKRVLWVANTVDRAVNMAQKGESHGILVEPYHSRYRYGDRLRRHRAVVDDFKGGSARGGVLAVTTQVCEVSLDISADLLVTELAPIPALIQRMGRLNRWATPDSNHGPLPALIIEPEGPSPYREPDLAVARRWVEETAGGPRSQSDLHRAFATALENDPPAPSVHSAWLDEVWTIEPAPLREPGATFSVLREEDLGHCLDQYGRPVLEEVIRYSVPMVYRPVAGEAHGWRQVAGVPVAPQDRMDYSDPWGARWR